MRRSLALVDLALENPDARQGTVSLVVVQAEADYESIGDLKAAVFDGDVDQPARRLVQESADCKAAGLAPREHIQEIAESQTRVDDVLDQQDVHPMNILVQVLGDAHYSGKRLPG